MLCIKVDFPITEHCLWNIYDDKQHKNITRPYLQEFIWLGGPEPGILCFQDIYLNHLTFHDLYWGGKVKTILFWFAYVESISQRAYSNYSTNTLLGSDVSNMDGKLLMWGFIVSVLGQEEGYTVKYGPILP